MRRMIVGFLVLPVAAFVLLACDVKQWVASYGSTLLAFGLEEDRVCGLPAWSAELIVVTVELILLPVAIVWLTARLWNRFRPKMILCGSHHHALQQLLAGLMLGLCCMSLTTLCVVFGPDALPDLTFTSVSSLAACLLVFPLCARPRPGLCAACGYDIRASLDMGRCPECGIEFPL